MKGLKFSGFFTIKSQMCILNKISKQNKEIKMSFKSNKWLH